VKIALAPSRGGATLCRQSGRAIATAEGSFSYTWGAQTRLIGVAPDGDPCGTGVHAGELRREGRVRVRLSGSLSGEEGVHAQRGIVERGGTVGIATPCLSGMADGLECSTVVLFEPAPHFRRGRGTQAW
jgi:hypothetical protein